jgi:succinylglutamate desuccinylase
MRHREVCIEPHPQIAGVHCVFRKENVSVDFNASDANMTASLPRPFIAIIGGMHGNEPCGRIAIEALIERASNGTLPVQDGTLVLIHGNPAASKEGLRHTADGTDLNRLFSYAFEENLPLERWTPEHHRALAMRPILEELDAALDLHSASAPTPPFGIVSTVTESRPLGRELGLPYLTHGWEGPGLLGDQVLLNVLTKRNKPSFAVECGQHDDPQSAQRAHDTAAHFLVATGILLPSAASALPEQVAIELNIVDAVKKPSPGFEFNGQLLGLQKIPAGTVVGSDANLEIRSKRPSFAIMPNASVAAGQDMLYLAHQVDPITLLPPE